MRLKAASYNRLCISLVWGLALLGLHGSAAQQPGRNPQAAAAASAIESCEARTINYITHTLPQQCLRTSWSSAANEAATAAAGPIVTSTTGEPTAAPETDEKNNGHKTGGETGGADDGQDQELATSSFMSFEEWKELQLRKAEQEAGDPKTRNKDDGSGHQQQQDGEGGRDDGELNLDFDALSEKVSEITASGAGPTGEAAGKQQEQQKQQQDKKGEDLAIYEGGDSAAQYTRSKDAGKTCKERFSYASFDAGATVLKTGPRAKNAKAILVENKDSYMLLECAQPNKFVIIELSDDVLVDTVVIANFEFFSSMIRTFRVSVSDRYPVKLEKWKVIGTFEARNQRDIQAFLVENPQIWAKYIRIEFLNHYGSEFYCPISLVRVHGTRMMDSWKEVEGGRDDDDEVIGQAVPAISQEPMEPQPPAEEEPSSPEPVAADNVTSAPPVVTEMGLTPWVPIFREFSSFEMCEMPAPTATDSGPACQSSVVSGPDTQPLHDGKPHDSVDGNRSTAQNPVSSLNSSIHTFEETGAPRGNVTMADPAASAYNTENLVSPSPLASTESPSGVKDSASTSSSTSTQASSPKSVNNSSKHKTLVSKPSSASVKPPTPKPSSTVPPSARNRTGTNTNSAPAASPTVQESFFKTVAKRLQLLESNTSLSMQYIEDQSRFLQDALAKMERKQISRVDSFLDTLNRTVLAELRSVRSQYDQIWQSTVIALESQRDQSQREIVALSDRLSVLAEEVVFQKRMAILQSILLLACLVLIIFSRAFGGAASTVTFSGTPRHSRWTFAMPMSPPPSAGLTGRRFGPSSPSRLGSIALRSPPQEDDDRLTTIDNRHRYADKTLPLTPTSEYDAGGREGTPVIHVVDETGEPSYFDDTASFSSPQRLGSEASDATPDLGYGSDTHVEAGDQALSSSEPADETNASRDEQAKYPPGGEESDGFKASAADTEVEGSGPPLTRTTLPDFGEARKPLPALPESP
ncbi:hypothetical protein MCOR25_000413 [Pyricularia grisea]|uniref:SUN domain-containing protein n=1 Tax=Pyricularia grisea TaxID=148305 RepID=A0A6P8AWY0_PYRGI|nr:uncharacterized protein PgNI_08882 [Pyricularia grisea]KAI6382898.1 hypothetical protein MCOR25_000413 [Pyricularia grisea]TLD06715.1 hypothetical protein PgNI_08882 [Pyricularia grisea]